MPPKTYVCSACGQTGHNRRSCGKNRTPPPKPPGQAARTAPHLPARNAPTVAETYSKATNTPSPPQADTVAVEQESDHILEADELAV